MNLTKSLLITIMLLCSGMGIQNTLFHSEMRSFVRQSTTQIQDSILYKINFTSTVDTANKELVVYAKDTFGISNNTIQQALQAQNKNLKVTSVTHYTQFKK